MAMQSSSKPIYLESISLKNFKNIKQLDLVFTAESQLSGKWACIAGINGAGKSSILQAICLLLLGEFRVRDLGQERLKRFSRRFDGDVYDAHISGVVRMGEKRIELELPLSGPRIDDDRLRSYPQYKEMDEFWEQMDQQMFLCYGATRNISDYQDTRYRDRNQMVQRQMTLFDPLAQVASIDALLEGGRRHYPTLKLLARLLDKILADEGMQSMIPTAADRITFSIEGTEVEAIDLPDGFRSTVAWLADVCSTWYATVRPEPSQSNDPADITGIVLLDEISLHLHPQLQRVLIPRLRKALPHVQFIVTTHSPMILSCFDRNELFMLDRDSADGVKQLDRQIFGLSIEDIYDWLMDTSTNNTVLSNMLEEGTDRELVTSYLYQSSEVNEVEAQRILEERRKLVNKLRNQ